MDRSVFLVSIRGIVSILFLVGLLVHSSQGASESSTCGDFNNSGNLSLADDGGISIYLFRGGPPPPDPTKADCDDYLLITVRDFQALSHFLLGGGPVPTCPITHAEPPPIDSSTVITTAGFAPAFSTATELIVTLTYTVDSMSAFVLPLQIQMEGVPVTFDSIILSHLTDNWELKSELTLRVDTAYGVVLLAGATLWDNHSPYKAPGTFEIARIQVSYPAADTARDFSYAWKPLRPLQTMAGYPDSSLIPMVNGRFSSGAKDGSSIELPQSSPTLASTRIKRGDINGNGMINVADMIALVSYMFSGGQAPSPLSIADVNCNSMVNVTDLIYLIAYFFNGGLPPCAG